VRAQIAIAPQAAAVSSHLYRDVGVVLRTYKLGEADRIVVLLTADNGKVRAVAKGVRKTTSKFGARLEPLSHVRLLLYRGRDLDIVSQAESVEPIAPLLSSLDRASQGMAVLEAADQLAIEREPNPQLYRMLVGVLRTIAERPAPLVVPAFYWKLLAAEGLRPELDACVRCGSSEPDVALVAFDLAEGGVLCRSCRSGTALGPAALGLLRAILDGRLNEALAVPESPATHEVGVLATRALEHHLERRLRAIAMFERH
jgi:DNA repair protein RecO (recombination protein O)